MSFQRRTFLGASVINYTSNIGWGTGNPSNLSVNLVEDPHNGDAFLPLRVGTPAVGQPVFFEHGSFVFNGILQKYVETNSREGLPTFHVEILDPREILDGAQVIMGGYSGITAGIPNIINAYGFLESTGYGNAQENEGGMPWLKVLDALNQIANTPGQGDYGGPLVFRGYSYGLDLTQMPVLPPEYRVSGPAMSLLGLISQLCEDGGCDFFITLDGFNIKVNTAQRLLQPPLGTITKITNTNTGNVVRSSNGLEVRNELTSSFLVGGDLSTLHLTSTLKSFWGYDIDGKPILGSPVFLWIPSPFIQLVPLTPRQRDQALRTPPPPILSATKPQRVTIRTNGGVAIGHFNYKTATDNAFDTMTLNASPVADILGSTSYECSTLEMLLAKNNYESWSMYVVSLRDDIARRVGMTSLFRANFGVPFRDGFALRNDQPNDANLLAAAAIATDIHAREQRMYQFVRGFADEYLGRKYAASVPFVLHKQDDETLKVSTSYEVADGGYLGEGAAPLGIATVNEDILQLPDTRFKAFVKFTDLDNVDYSAISPEGSVIQNNGLFLEVQVDPIFIYTPSPGVVITLPGPVTEMAVDAVGNLDIMRGMLGAADRAMAQDALQQNFIPLKISPQTKKPAAAAIPLKSNTLSYGPWSAFGAPGKVKIEQDQSLTPWNYGGYDVLDKAADARVQAAVTNMQVCETGDIELAGLPTISLGGVLQNDGPNLTGIDVSIGKDGVTSRYRFSTFTPRPMGVSKSAVDRLKRVSLAGVELRRNIRGAIRDRQLRTATIGNANRANRAFQELAPPAVQRRSPVDVLTSYSQYDSINQKTYVTTQASTFEEAITLSNADSSTRWQSTAAMHLNGLVRPFSTLPGANTSGYLPAYGTTRVSGFGPNQTHLNPFKSSGDIDVMAWGSTYQGLHATREGRSPDFTNVRAMALRGPAVLAGWGVDLIGNAVPANTGVAKVAGLYQEWASGYMNRQDLWKVGPIDLRWDEYRGVWTTQNNLKGRLKIDLPGNGSGLMAVDIVGTPFNASGAPSGIFDILIYNYFDATVSSGTRAFATYLASDNRWWITSANC